VDLSGIIFVALAVAWAAYLIPKALRHHDEVARSRSIERFSNTMRVLARREPVNRRDARLVVTPTRSASGTLVETKPVRLTAAQLRAHREVTRRATQRRQRVLGGLLLVNAVVIGTAAFGVVGGWWATLPAGLIVAWLVACRVMVKSERAALAPRGVVPTVDAAAGPDLDISVQKNAQGFEELAPDSDTGVVPAVTEGDPNLWDPLPMTLPTYVDKPAAARRTVRTISIDDSGVWTSGRTEVDAAIAREADEQRSKDKAQADGKTSGKSGEDGSAEAVGS